MYSDRKKKTVSDPETGYHVERECGVRFPHWSGRWTSLVSPQSKREQVQVGNHLVSLTCNLEAFHAVYIQAGIHHPALVTGFHGTRPKLHQHVHQCHSPKEVSAHWGADRVPGCEYYNRRARKDSEMETRMVKQRWLTYIATEFRDSFIVRTRVHNIWPIYRYRVIRFSTRSGTARGELWMIGSDLSSICRHTPCKFACHFVQQSELCDIAGSGDYFHGHSAQQRRKCKAYLEQ